MRERMRAGLKEAAADCCKNNEEEEGKGEESGEEEDSVRRTSLCPARMHPHSRVPKILLFQKKTRDSRPGVFSGLEGMRAHWCCSASLDEGRQVRDGATPHFLSQWPYRSPPLDGALAPPLKQDSPGASPALTEDTHSRGLL
ncbi:unnamed protein product [Pleuronectes platessa]|uniref:Uncharacterized protein n=1 Tax=Pleuronectes platessa TaxID=8262 RepID=A0A9N7VJF6_PLEPL|nr:unnamed protein product [Pleuronectes platessa]